MSKLDPYDPRQVREALEATGFVLRKPTIAMIRPKAETKTETGIYIPDTAQVKPKFGTVVWENSDDCQFRYGRIPVFARIPIPLYETTSMGIELSNGDTIMVDFLHEEEILAWYPTKESLIFENARKDPTRAPGEVREEKMDDRIPEVPPIPASMEPTVDPPCIVDTIDGDSVPITLTDEIIPEGSPERTDPFHGVD